MNSLSDIVKRKLKYELEFEKLKQEKEETKKQAQIKQIESIKMKEPQPIPKIIKPFKEVSVFLSREEVKLLAKLMNHNITGKTSYDLFGSK